MFQLKLSNLHVATMTMLLWIASLQIPASAQSIAESVKKAQQESAEKPNQFISGKRQLTLSGLRSGEGYFNSDGTQMVFQSERDPANPFYQIYLMDFEFGDVTRISPAWQNDVRLDSPGRQASAVCVNTRRP